MRVQEVAYGKIPLTWVTNSGRPFAMDSKYAISFVKSFQDASLPPDSASQAKYGKLFIMKKSTAFDIWLKDRN